jgi:hypothetical protein
MMTADPLGRALRADLSIISALNGYTAGLWGRTSFCVSDVAFWETSEIEIETLVDVSDILLEVCPDLGELAVSSSYSNRYRRIYLSTVGSSHQDPTCQSRSSY